MMGNTRWMRAAWVLIALVCALAAIPESAQAQSPATILGMHSRSIGLGGAVSASVSDYSAVYYNPAGLANRTDLQLGIGPAMVFPNFKYSNFAGTRKGPVDPFMTQSFGAVIPIGGPLKKRVAVGVGALTPFPNLTTIRIRTPEQPSFVFTEDLLQTPVILFGLAFRPSKYFTLGAGGQLIIQAKGEVHRERADAAKGEVRTAFNLSNATITGRDTALTVNPVIAPIFGIQIVPVRFVRLGFFFRSEVKPDIELPFSADAGIISIQAQFVSNVLYAPQQIGGGIAFEFLDQFVLSADGVFVKTSKTPAPGIQLRVTPDALIAPIATIDPNPGFSDTFQVHFGLEYKFNEDVRFRAGYMRRTTPVPQQVYDTSFLDESITAYSFGVGVTLKDPTEILEKPFTVDFHTQFQQMDEGIVRRASPLHPIGDLTFSGWLLNIGLQGTVRF